MGIFKIRLIVRLYRNFSLMILLYGLLEDFNIQIFFDSLLKDSMDTVFIVNTIIKIKGTIKKNKELLLCIVNLKLL